MNRTSLGQFVRHLLNGALVVGPQAGHDHTIFAPLASPDALRLDCATTTIPPGRLFLPPEETLLRFDAGTGTFAPVLPEPEPTVLFGVHPCDLHAIALMDEIMTEEPADAHYIARRRATTVVGWDCRRPCHEQTLCFDKGTLHADTGYDLLGIDLDETVVWRARTAAGERLLDGAPGLRSATDRDRSALAQANRERDGRFVRRLRRDVMDLPAALRLSANDRALWVDDVGRRCISCGNCTMVCPTCYCFDVHDRVDLDLQGGERLRVWDSCQFCEFSAVAGGEIFRETEADREFHRVFKKEVYLLERFGSSGCVGCGRCNRACPAGISLIDIYNAALTAGRA